MPTHDPARKRRAFRRVPRKRKVFVEASPRAESEHTCARAMYDYGKDVVQPTVCEQACTGPMLLGSLKDLAYLVWESDYASLFELEQLALEESGRLMTAAALLKAVPEKSTARLGTDLVTVETRNSIYATGGAPETVNSTQTLVHRPWEFIWRVAEGTSVGVGRGGTGESWERIVDRFLSENLFSRHHTFA